MDLPQAQDWERVAPPLKEGAVERVKIFRWLVGSLFALIAATFVLMMWVIGSPDTYHQHAAEVAAKWPDGSTKTAQDWWAKPGSKPPTQVAQPPAPAPQKPPSQG